MKKALTLSAAAVLAFAVVAPAFAGGDHCGGRSTNATTADAKMECAGHATAWAGAWMHRSSSGRLTVADVAKGSPADRAGLRAGDIVVAVNGYNVADNEGHAQCASKADCNVGSSLTYTVLRGRSTKEVKLKLEKMPANTAGRYANHQASFDPAVAALVMSR